MRRLQNDDRGIALVGAIFLLVVLAFLGVIMVSLFGVESQTIGMTVNGARCYQAAKAGAEWGISQVLAGNCATAQGATWTVDGYSVSTTCQQDSYTEATQTYRVYRIGARAERGTYGEIDYVSRRVEVKVTDAN